MPFLLIHFSSTEDPSPVVECLEETDLKFQLSDFFEDLAPFAKDCASLQKKKIKVEVEEADFSGGGGGDAVTPNPVQDHLIPSGLHNNHLEDESPILKEEAVKEEMADDVSENQNQWLPDHVDSFGGIIDEDMEDSPDVSSLMASPKELVKKRSRQAVAAKSCEKKKESKGEMKEDRKRKVENSGSDGVEERNEKAKRRRRIESEGDASDGGLREGTAVDRKVLSKKKRCPLASPIEDKKKETGGKKEEEREKEDEDDRMGGGLGDFDCSDDSDEEEQSVKDSVAKAMKESLRGNTTLNEDEEEDPEDVEMNETAEDDELEKDDQEERDCPVDGCSEKCPSDEALKKHMKTHPHPLICGVCKRPWPSAAGLREHHRVHSGAKPFNCPTCKRQFSLVCNLKKHIRLHTGETPYGCGLCGEKFKNPGSLDYHRRKHNDETMFACTACDYRSASTGNLKQHMRKHTGEKPFKCTDCYRCFSFKKNLEQHKAAIHMGLKKLA